MKSLKVALVLAAVGIANAQHFAYGGPQVYSARVAGPVAYAQRPVAKVAPALAYASPIAKVAKAVVPQAYDPYPQYSFGYAVQDALTGDQHSHTEARDGDVVKGQYQLVETDGSIRTVTYTADPVNGFNAVVDRSPAPAAVVKSPVYAHAPVAKAVAAPAAYSPAYLG